MSLELLKSPSLSSNYRHRFPIHADPSRLAGPVYRRQRFPLHDSSSVQRLPPQHSTWSSFYSNLRHHFLTYATNSLQVSSRSLQPHSRQFHIFNNWVTPQITTLKLRALFCLLQKQPGAKQQKANAVSNCLEAFPSLRLETEKKLRLSSRCS